MFLSISLILIVGMDMGWICQKVKLPRLLGISAELRKIALVIILSRAGLGLDLSGLKKIGRPSYYGNRFFLFDSHHVYGNGNTEKAGAYCPKAYEKIWKALGCS